MQFFVNFPNVQNIQIFIGGVETGSWTCKAFNQTYLHVLRSQRYKPQLWSVYLLTLFACTNVPLSSACIFQSVVTHNEFKEPWSNGYGRRLQCDSGIGVRQLCLQRDQCSVTRLKHQQQKTSNDDIAGNGRSQVYQGFLIYHCISW